MREVDGIKVAFVDGDAYFSTLGKPSMHSAQKETGADIVLLLGEGKTEDDITDEHVRELLRVVAGNGGGE